MTAPGKMLVVDDEPAIRRLLRRALERAGYAVVEAATAGEAMAALRIDRPEAVLLDLGLPDRDGLELVAPVIGAGAALIVISARDATGDKVTALDLGADDYVTKPFDTDEVLARVRTAIRHRRLAGTPLEVVRAGDLEIDLARRSVRKGGADVHLAPKEFALLAELAKNAGKVITHSQLLRTVWGPAHAGDIEYLRVTVRSVRRKLGEGPERSAIRNEPGIGYRLIIGYRQS